jgi:hypothetical protein
MKKKYVICKVEENVYKDAWIVHVLNRGEFKTFQEFMTAIVDLGLKGFKEDRRKRGSPINECNG